MIAAEINGDSSFRPEAQLTLFLRTHTKEIAKTAKMYFDRRVIPLLQEIRVTERMTKSDF